jgi:hypothetical protein
MCLCEEARRSNLLVLAGFLPLNLPKHSIGLISYTNVKVVFGFATCCSGGFIRRMSRKALIFKTFGG